MWLEDNKNGAKSHEAEVVQVVNEWIYPVVRYGNIACNIIYVKNKCVGTPEVAVNDVGVQASSNNKVVSDKSVDTIKVAVADAGIQTNIRAEVEVGENKTADLKNTQGCKGSQRRRNVVHFRGGKDVLTSKLRDEVVDNGRTQWRSPGSGGHQTGTFGKMKCFKCGRFGHVEKWCTERGCFACGKFGHVVRNSVAVGGFVDY